MLLFQELLLMDKHQTGNKTLVDFPIYDILKFLFLLDQEIFQQQTVLLSTKETFSSQRV